MKADWIKPKRTQRKNFTHLAIFNSRTGSLSPLASKGHPVLLLHFLLLDVKRISNCDAVTEH